MGCLFCYVEDRNVDIYAKGIFHISLVRIYELLGLALFPPFHSVFAGA